MKNMKDCFRSDTKPCRFTRFKVIIGLNLETAKAGEAQTRSLRDKSDTSLDIPEIMKTIDRYECSGHKVGMRYLRKPANDNSSRKERMFRDSYMACDDDVEVTTPLTENYYEPDDFIDPMTPERLVSSAEEEYNNFLEAKMKKQDDDPSIPFFARCLISDSINYSAWLSLKEAEEKRYDNFLEEKMKEQGDDSNIPFFARCLLKDQPFSLIEVLS